MTIVDSIERRFAAIRTAETRAALAELRSREQVLELALKLAEAAEAEARQDETPRGGKP
jgi:hypothetical protein